MKYGVEQPGYQRLLQANFARQTIMTTLVESASGYAALSLMPGGSDHDHCSSLLNLAMKVTRQ
jgi:hypothetical protein